MIKKSEGKALNHRTFIKRSGLNIKKSSVGEPLAKLRFLSSVSRLCWIAKGGQERLIGLGWCDKTKFEGKALKHRPYIKCSELLRARLYTNLNPRYALKKVLSLLKSDFDSIVK